jgi:hypothetical protein
MPRPLASLLAGRSGLGLCAAGLSVLALSPWTWPGSWLHGPVVTILAPVQATVRSAVVAMRGPAPGVSDNAELERLRTAVEEANARFLRAQAEADDLRRLIRDLSRFGDLNPASGDTIVIAPVIGPGPDLSGGQVTLRAGEREGVVPGAVVAVGGVHVIGRITRVQERTSSVLPVTHLPPRGGAGAGGAGAAMVRGVVMLDETTIGPMANLQATGDGTLQGRVEDDADPNAPARAPIAPGMLVRLNDEAWPAGSRMLILGTVVAVEPVPASPLRQRITVAPMHTLERWREAMIRVPASAKGAGGIAP